jgi:hypothetical protein
LTDKTPHKILAPAERTYRQFFKLVVGPIDVWSSKHNTPSPFGIVPTAPIDNFDAIYDKSPEI